MKSLEQQQKNIEQNLDAALEKLRQDCTHANIDRVN